MRLTKTSGQQSEGLNKIIMRIIGGKSPIKSDTWPTDIKVVVTQKCWRCDTCQMSSPVTATIWLISTGPGFGGFSDRISALIFPFLFVL